MPEEITGTAEVTVHFEPPHIPAERHAEAAKNKPGEGREYLGAAVTPGTIDREQRTVDVIWFTGIDVPRMSWEGKYIRRFDPRGVDLSLLNSGAPVFDNHNTYTGSESQKGVVDRAWVDKGMYKATLRFSRRPEINGLWQDIEEKIVQKFSMGVEILAEHEIKADGQTTVRLADKWRPFEISIAPLPADFGTTTLSADQMESVAQAVRLTEEPSVDFNVVDQRASAQAKETPVMETTQAAGEETRQNEVTLAAARDEAVKAERLRATNIRTMTTPFKLDEKFVTALIDEGASVEIARERIMTKLASQWDEHKTSAINTSVTMVADATDKRRAGMEAAILFRGNPGDAKLRDAGAEYAGMTLMDVARECLDAVGVKTRGMSRNEVARVALQGRFGAEEYFAGGGSMTTSDFPNILANVANKTLRQAYEAAPRTFTPFCRQVSASDSKPINRVQLSDVPTLPKVNEQGEYHRTSLTDSKETYSLATFGEIVAITRRVIVNDDLQALTRIPAALGQAAANLESDTVWAVITANANLADGVPLFHATHRNLNGTNALASGALGTARAAFRVQKAPKGTILNLQPRYLIVPAALEQTADQLIYPINLAATTVSGVVPSWVQSLVKIVEGRLDAVASVGLTNWFMAVDPSQIDTIEYCYLEGQQGVYIETRQGFEVDGVEIKARLDFAAGAIDFRGLCKNTVA